MRFRCLSWRRRSIKRIMATQAKPSWCSGSSSQSQARSPGIFNAKQKFALPPSSKDKRRSHLLVSWLSALPFHDRSCPGVVGCKPLRTPPEQVLAGAPVSALNCAHSISAQISPGLPAGRPRLILRQRLLRRYLVPLPSPAARSLPSEITLRGRRRLAGMAAGNACQPMA